MLVTSPRRGRHEPQRGSVGSKGSLRLGRTKGGSPLRSSRERGHEKPADGHEPRLGQQLGQGVANRNKCEAADSGGAPVGPLALAAFELQADQQADTERQQQADDA